MKNEVNKEDLIEHSFKAQRLICYMYAFLAFGLSILFFLAAVGVGLTDIGDVVIGSNRTIYYSDGTTTEDVIKYSEPQASQGKYSIIIWSIIGALGFFVAFIVILYYALFRTREQFAASRYKKIVDTRGKW